MGTTSPSAPSSKHAIGVVWLTVFIDLVGFSVIFPIFPAMLDWYLPREESGSMLHTLIGIFKGLTHGDNQQFLVAVLFGGLLGSLYSVLQFFSSPFWGRLSDHHGRRKILLITTTGTAVAYALWIFSGSFWVLVISRVLGGIMAGNLAVATASVADLTDSSKRSKGMALIGVAFGLGFILGPALGGLGSLVDLGVNPQSTAAFGLTPFSFPALLAFLMALFNIVWVWRAFPETLDATHMEENRKKPSPLLRLGSKIPDVRRALKVYFLFIFAFAGMEFTLTFLALERLLYEPHNMALLFLFIGLVLSLTQGFVVRRYAHRFGERNFTTLGLLSACLSLICLSISQSTGLFYTGLALLGFGVGCASPSLSALVSLYSPANRQGSELGAFRSIGSMGRALGPLYGAGLYWWMGSQVAYLTSAILLFVAVLFSILLPNPTQEPATEKK
ncbi:MFS transporter [Puniceicoccales bacterium CK1056]|uniref:MFS transporter n=1 Tax=Oceanipulchritudo coccoides TaxID=2706888 RepID=A0A6B2M186_9BACT|nr:MFS transporter [Oceanipulchritudo coccoides]NDV61827.1 MFS transporter [Oceanipulchritudo coccoides]